MVDPQNHDDPPYIFSFQDDQYWHSVCDVPCRFVKLYKIFGLDFIGTTQSTTLLGYYGMFEFERCYPTKKMLMFQTSSISCWHLHLAVSSLRKFTILSISIFNLLTLSIYSPSASTQSLIGFVSSDYDPYRFFDEENQASLSRVIFLACTI